MMKNFYSLILCSFIFLSGLISGQEDKKINAKIESKIMEGQINLKAVVTNNTTIYKELNYLLVSIKKGNGSMISECDWSYDGSKIALKTNDFNGYNVKIYIIDMVGGVVKTILTGVAGAAGGLNFSVDGQLLLYTKDVSAYQDGSGNYRQLDSRIFIYNLATNTTIDISTESYKPLGTNDLDPRFSPNNAQVIFMNTSNDNVSQKNVMTIDLSSSMTDLVRTALFSNAEMPDYE